MENHISYKGKQVPIMGPAVTVYLSRRNLQTLLNKLDRVKGGGISLRTIIKYDSVHPVYPQSHASIQVTAIEDADYYTDRNAGIMHPKDAPE